MQRQVKMWLEDGPVPGSSMLRPGMFVHCPLRDAVGPVLFLQKCKVLGCDIIGLQETQRPGRTEFAAAGYRVFCSGVDGNSSRAGQHGVGLAVKEFIIHEAT